VADEEEVDPSIGTVDEEEDVVVVEDRRRLLALPVMTKKSVARRDRLPPPCRKKTSHNLLAERLQAKTSRNFDTADLFRLILSRPACTCTMA
jgi:hypothetical protein